MKAVSAAKKPLTGIGHTFEGVKVKLRASLLLLFLKTILYTVMPTGNTRQFCEYIMPRTETTCRTNRSALQPFPGPPRKRLANLWLGKWPTLVLHTNRRALPF